MMLIISYFRGIFIKEKKKFNAILKDIEARLCIRFKKPELLFRALSHTSFVHEKLQVKKEENLVSNERLEFLGDSVIGLVIVETLFKKYPDTAEGELAKTKAVLASEPLLSGFAKSLDLGEFLFLGKGEELSGGRTRDSILADGIEAICGALYLDRGYDRVKDFILSYFDSTVFDAVIQEKMWIDYKTKLQELTQGEFKILPEYLLLKTSGPAHNPVFVIEANINSKPYAQGTGKTKKDAEQDAAKKAYFLLQQELKKKEG